MNKRRSGNVAWAIGLSAGTAPAAWAAYEINLPPPATTIAQQIYDLHNLVLLVCLGIFFAVFLPMFYALWRHRKSRGHQAQPIREHLLLEISWTVAAFLLLVVMAIPTTKLVMAMKDTGESAMSIKVTGRQWKWEYEYLGQDLKFISNLATTQDEMNGRAPKGEHYLIEVDRPLVVPTGQKIRLLMTAEDVIHAWWVPALGVKQDTIPGFIRDAWIQVDEPGTYRGQCAELCGVGHAYMPIVLEAVPPEQFAAWLAEQKTLLAAASVDSEQEHALADLISRGEKVYLANCAACHQATGLGIPGAFPGLDRSPLVTGPKAAHLALVFHGKAGTTMQAFGKQLSDIDIAAVVTFERNQWHNQLGDAVQPREVAALRRAAAK